MTLSIQQGSVTHISNSGCEAERGKRTEKSRQELMLILRAQHAPGMRLSSLCLFILFYTHHQPLCYYNPHFTRGTREVKLPAQGVQPTDNLAEIYSLSPEPTC